MSIYSYALKIYFLIKAHINVIEQMLVNSFMRFRYKTVFSLLVKSDFEGWYPLFGRETDKNTAPLKKSWLSFLYIQL